MAWTEITRHQHQHGGLCYVSDTADAQQFSIWDDAL
jgi:hypothetical protein